MAVFAAVLASCSGGGGTAPATTTVTSVVSVTTTTVTVATTTSAITGGTTTSVALRLPEGFESGAVEVRLADGRTVELCVLLATTGAQRGQGLMEVTGLGRYAGMLFAFPGATTGQFYMLNTRIPLSIAFFAEDGAFVSSTDMQPCPSTDAAACPLYSASGPYLNAIEVPLGDLARLGIGEGSHLTVTDRPC